MPKAAYSALASLAAAGMLVTGCNEQQPRQQPQPQQPVQGSGQLPPMAQPPAPMVAPQPAQPVSNPQLIRELATCWDAYDEMKRIASVRADQRTGREKRIFLSDAEEFGRRSEAYGEWATREADRQGMSGQLNAISTEVMNEFEAVLDRAQSVNEYAEYVVPIAKRCDTQHPLR